MSMKLPLAAALIGLLPVVVVGPGYAAEPPPVDPGMAAEPADPDAAPYPPDGVTDPNVDYPTDGTEGTDQGEAGVDGPASPAADAPAPPAGDALAPPAAPALPAKP
jgi:hypothetical protein